MRRVLITIAALAIAVVLQVTMVNRLPLPHGAVPSLVLILVACVSVTDGPEAGAITGFCAGLALDIAPPGSHLVGEYALVYCLIGYAVGRVGRIGDLNALPAVLVAAAGAAAGEALSAGLGVMLSDPEVTWAAAKGVLPAAVIYDVLLTPFMFGLMSLIRPAPQSEGYVASGGHSRSAFGGASPALGAAGAAGAVGAFRPAGSGGAPRLRLTGIPSPAIRPQMPRREPRLKLAGLTSPAINPRFVRRDPKLKLAGLTSPAINPRFVRRDPKLRLSGSGPRRTAAPAGRPVKLAFGPRRGSGLISGGVLRAGSAGPSAFATRSRKTPKFGTESRGPIAALARLTRPRVRKARPGRGWLKTKPAPKPRAVRSPGRRWLKSKPARKMYPARSVPKNWVRSSRRRRALSRLGGLR